MMQQTPIFDMASLRALKLLSANMPLSRMVRRKCFVAQDNAGIVWAVSENSLDLTLRKWVDFHAGAHVRMAQASADDLQAIFVLSEADAPNAEQSAQTESAQGLAQGEDISIAAVNASEHEVVRFVKTCLRDALLAGASDIHFESHGHGLGVKFRLDGLLAQSNRLDQMHLSEQVVARIKVLAGLDITERRIPQDGKFRGHDGSREIDFRVSVMPSVFGEDVVIRILDKKALLGELQSLTLDTLGIDEGIKNQMRQLVKKPYGMLLVTGPTGSGKTTTLYAAISEINTGKEKIITIEDPVEYQLQGVLQIPVNEKKGLTFATGLRSILRHDPDQIMVGEIRDAETATIAVQAALTGHLVLTTLHANNSIDVIGRLLHMNVDLYGLLSCLNGIVAQRLIRILCSECKAPVVDDSEQSPMPGKANYQCAVGCGHCRGTGYLGRKAIAELLVINDELRDLIVSRASISALRIAALKHGMQPLREVALRLAAEGLTSLEEVERVTLAI